VVANRQDIPVDPFDELSLYYQFREALTGRISRTRWSLWAQMAIVLAPAFAPITLSPRMALVGGSIGIVLSGLGATAVFAARRERLLGRALADTLSQVIRCDGHIKERRRRRDPVPPGRCRTAEALLTYRLQAMRPHVVTALKESGIVPLRFPLSSTQAAYARVMIASTRFHAAETGVLGAVRLLLIFVVGWTAVLMTIWGLDPAVCPLDAVYCSGAFQGIGARSMPGEFYYLMLNAALANMPPDVIARSDFARAAFAGIFTSGALLLVQSVAAALADVRSQVVEVPPQIDEVN